MSLSIWGHLAKSTELSSKGKVCVASAWLFQDRSSVASGYYMSDLNYNGELLSSLCHTLKKGGVWLCFILLRYLLAWEIKIKTSPRLLVFPDLIYVPHC